VGTAVVTWDVRQPSEGRADFTEPQECRLCVFLHSPGASPDSVEKQKELAYISQWKLTCFRIYGSITYGLHGDRHAFLLHHGS
jgi:hypothetical protein